MWSSSRYVILTVIMCLNLVSSLHVQKLPIVPVQSGTSNNNVDPMNSCSNSNCTWYEVVTKKEETVASEAPIVTSTSPPMWCPNNYELMLDNGMWYHLCRPQPCVDIPVLEIHEKHFSFDKPHVENAEFNETSSNRRVCSKDLKEFRNRFRPSNCQRVKLLPGEFVIEQDGSLLDKVDNHTLSIGEYFIQLDHAVVCKNLFHSPHSDDVIWSCIPFTISPDKYTISSNGSLIVTSLSVEITPHFYYVDNSSNAHVCFRNHKQFESCTFLIDLYPEDQIRLLDNFTLFTNKDVIVLYSVGHYIISQDKARAVVCTAIGQTKTETTFLMYGISSVISAVFSFVTVIIHLLFPNINHHAKSLMCHIISLFLMYLIVAVRYFVNAFDVGVPRLVIFAFQYVFSLSTFFWLNVIAFELWRVFAKLQGHIAPGPRQEKKRLFLVKCIYSWGIPLLLCCVAIGVSLNPDAQRALGMMLHLSESIWFSDKITVFVFFYGPILVILIINLVLFCWTILNIRKLNQGSDILNSKISKKL
ncbi:hypothetical protein CHUAL_000291 [Chamberlinius hualienensis]